jgi:hypothetical protein
VEKTRPEHLTGYPTGSTLKTGRFRARHVIICNTYDEIDPPGILKAD